MRQDHKTVLLVEGHEPLRDLMQEYLESLGYHVVSAADGLNAAYFIRTLGESIDILVTDMITSGARGTDIAHLGRQRFPTLKVIYMSAYSDVRKREHGPSNAAFLEKPFDLRLLAGTIRQLLDQGIG